MLAPGAVRGARWGGEGRDPGGRGEERPWWGMPEGGRKFAAGSMAPVGPAQQTESSAGRLWRLNGRLLGCGGRVSIHFSVLRSPATALRICVPFHFSFFRSQDWLLPWQSSARKDKSASLSLALFEHFLRSTYVGYCEIRFIPIP